MFFDYFNAKDAKAFGTDLAKYYLSKAIYDTDKVKQKNIAKTQRELFKNLSQKIEIYKQSHQLNIYKKAQIVNVFKWYMLEAGFEPNYVDELSSWVTHNL